jgi:molybdate transport system regulatory protein
MVPQSKWREEQVELSARNQLRGTVTSVKLGTIMSEVAVDIGGQEIVAAITKASAERLGLQVGAEVTVVIKATEVMIATS